MLHGELVVDPRAFGVTVSDGVVTLGRKPETSEIGHQIVRRGVRHVQGVVAESRDRLSYPDVSPVVGRPGVLSNDRRHRLRGNLRPGRHQGRVAVRRVTIPSVFRAGWWWWGTDRQHEGEF